MEVLLLGPVEVRDGSRSVPLGGPKRRALLALLALHANEVISSDRLVDELWGTRSPRNAVASLHNHVSRLRKELGSDLLLTGHGGYELRVDGTSVDALRFEDALSLGADSPAAERATALRGALSWWRGEPLADLAFESCLSVQTARLSELRLVALERRIDADLELGAAAELVPELEQLIAAEPLRERFRAQLILALYRSGRQAAALEAYRETRRHLDDELGLEPGPELRELERAVLRQDPGLAPPHAHVAPPRPDAGTWPRRRRVPLLAALAAVGAIAGFYAFTSNGGGASNGHGAVPVAAGAATTSAFHTVRATTGYTKRNARASASRQTVHVARTTRRPRTITSHHATAPVPRRSAPTKTAPRTPVRQRPVATTIPTAPTAASRKRRPVAPPRPHPPAATTTTAIPTTTTTTTAAAAAPPSLALPTTWWNGKNEADIQLVRSPGSIAVTVPATAKDGWNVFAQTRCRAVGDFDARAHFQLKVWPGADGVYLSLAAADLSGVNTYRTDAFGESFGSYIPPSGGTSVHATGTSGWLRLARSGASIASSYSDDGVAWTGLYTGSGPTDSTAITLAVYNLPSVAPFAGMPASVTFDSFALSALTLDC